MAQGGRYEGVVVDLNRCMLHDQPGEGMSMRQRTKRCHGVVLP